MSLLLMWRLLLFMNWSNVRDLLFTLVVLKIAECELKSPPSKIGCSSSLSLFIWCCILVRYGVICLLGEMYVFINVTLLIENMFSVSVILSVLCGRPSLISVIASPLPTCL